MVVQPDTGGFNRDISIFGDIIRMVHQLYSLVNSEVVLTHVSRSANGFAQRISKYGERCKVV